MSERTYEHDALGTAVGGLTSDKVASGSLVGSSVARMVLTAPEHTHTREHQDKVRAEIEADRKAFLAAGGKITKVPRTN